MKKNPHFTRNWIILLSGLILIAGVFGAFSWQVFLSPKNPEGKVQIFIVKNGESVSSVASRLEEEGLIRSSLLFRLKIKRQKGFSIEAGDFKLSSSMDLDQIINELSKPPADRWVTILEGWRVEEIADRLNRELGVNNENFIKAAKKYEGYLFPDTYLFNREASVDTIISTLRNTFDKRLSQDLQNQITAKGLTVEEGVILASIVEREARSDEVRTKVASILLKRFKIGMGLQADATIQYVIGYQPAEKSWWKRNLSLDDLKVDSVFNTYLHAGLPPAPICNPSLSSLKAVANADLSTPYLYYYHDSKGNSYYAKTLDEHNNNVASNK